MRAITEFPTTTPASPNSPVRWGYLFRRVATDLWIPALVYCALALPIFLPVPGLDVWALSIFEEVDAGDTALALLALVLCATGAMLLLSRDPARGDRLWSWIKLPARMMRGLVTLMGAMLTGVAVPIGAAVHPVIGGLYALIGVTGVVGMSWLTVDLEARLRYRYDPADVADRQDRRFSGWTYLCTGLLAGAVSVLG